MFNGTLSSLSTASIGYAIHGILVLLRYVRKATVYIWIRSYRVGLHVHVKYLDLLDRAI